MDNLKKLADALDTTIDDLIGGASPQTQDATTASGTLAALYEAARKAGRAKLREEGVLINRLPAGFRAAAGRPSLTSVSGRRRVRDLYEVEISGSCMRPRVEPGDMVLVDPDADWADGDVVVAAWNGHAVLKTVEWRDGLLVLTAKDGTVLVPTAETRILGVVVYFPR
jgi:SOS-response transcriptional repressor LexA